MEEFIYWRHIIPHGIKIEEISGCNSKSGDVWRTLAYQIYGEYGKTGFRSILHTESGVPILEDEAMRISITHTDHILAVATLPKTPEANLTVFDVRTALGIDAERRDRAQILSLRARFLSENELAIIPEESLDSNLMAWTAKEALYKAALTPGIDWRSQIHILSLPTLQTEFPLDANMPLGKAEIIHPGENPIPMNLFSYISDDYIITVAFSPKCAKFKKGNRG